MPGRHLRDGKLGPVGDGGLRPRTADSSGNASHSLVRLSLSLVQPWALRREGLFYVRSCLISREALAAQIESYFCSKRSIFFSRKDCDFFLASMLVCL